MSRVTATEAKQGLASVIDAAAREPVAIERSGRGVAVVLSVHEHERLGRLNVGDFQRFCDRVGAASVEAGMTKDRLTELLEDD